MTELPYVLPLFLTFSRKKSHLDAVPAHFFKFFLNFRAFGGGINAHRRCPTLQGAGHDIADFGVIWGRFFFSVKNYPFLAGNAQNGGVLEKKSGIFVVGGGGLGPSRPPNSAKLFLGQPHYSALREKKSPQFFF